MDADPGQSVRTHEGLVARAGRRGRPRRQGLGHGQRRQHRRHHGQRPAAHGPHQGRVPPGHRHADPGARRGTPTVLLDAGANAECSPEWLVQFAQMGAVFARARFGIERPQGRPAVDRRGADQGQPAGQGDPHAAGRRRAGSAPRGGRVHRQRRGPRPHDRRRRRRRHRRLHRQRRPQDPRGRHAVAGRRPARARSTPTTRPRPPAEVLLPALLAALRPARPREHRRRHAARRRRRVHHQPRLVVGGGHRQRRAGGPRHGRRRRRRPPQPGRPAPLAPDTAPSTRPRSTANFWPSTREFVALHKRAMSDRRCPTRSSPTSRRAARRR